MKARASAMAASFVSPLDAILSACAAIGAGVVGALQHAVGMQDHGAGVAHHIGIAGVGYAPAISASAILEAAIDPLGNSLGSATVSEAP